MKEPIFLAAVAVLFAGCGPETLPKREIIAVKWFDADSSNPAFHGVFVWAIPAADGQVDVFFEIHRGRDTGQKLEPMKVGTVASYKRAVQQFGELRLDKEGLHIGPQPDAYLLERRIFDAYR